MSGNKTQGNKNAVINHTAEQLRRTWLAGLGVVSLTRKHGGQWVGRFVEESQELAARSTVFVRETAADVQAQATGVFSPILLRAEKQFDVCAKAVENNLGYVLNRFGIPSKRELDDLSRQLAALTRKLKAAK